VLRAAVRLVTPGGRLVITTPNTSSLRRRLEQLTRGQLTFFRPDYAPHVTPAVAHVIERVVHEEGLSSHYRFGGRDVIPFTGGRDWSHRVRYRAPELTSLSLVVVGVAGDGLAGER
jgi:hypothetical protein